MSGLEVVAITLGAAVARAACGIWFGDAKLLSAVSGSIIDLTERKLTSTREQRRFRRVWEEAAEHIAGRIQPLVEREFRDLPAHELVAALDAVRDTFEAAALTEDDLYKQDLDAGYLDRYLRSQDRDRAARAGLAEDAVRAYDLVLRESCAYAIEVARTLPGAGFPGVAELLSRDRQILADIEKVLARLPERRGIKDFARDYRQLVANRLDRVEFFGATLSESSRRYPLSVAYLSLTASTLTPTDPVTRAIERVTETMGGPPPGSVERVLVSANRVFVRGQAGIGKTTLLHWIAVQAARDPHGPMPFFLPLRRYAAAELPGPEAFLHEVGRHIADEMPAGWVQEQLRSGHAVVLVDGIDELPEERRDQVRRWLGDLIATFPRARYVVTSRPAAAPREWLDDDGFLPAELEPMTPSQVRVFVNRWHEAMRSMCRTEPDRAEVTAHEERLLRELDKRRQLRQLAGYPLFCALICALHRDRRGQLPANRMELFEVALHMLLERRDRERGIAAGLTLGRTEQTLLLCDLAYWLIRNGWSDAARAPAVARLSVKLRGMPGITAAADQVYRMLLERTGLLREQVEGRFDFVHRSFQEYLAAQQAVHEEDFGMLIRHAHLPEWHEVVVMAAGHASANGRDGLLRGLLDRAGASDTTRGQRDALRLVALACLETSPERSPELDRTIRKAAARLVPPKSESAARALGRAGPFGLDLLLAAPTPSAEEERVRTIQAVAQIGDPAGLPLLSRFGTEDRYPVVQALIQAWPTFDPDEYARRVLHDSPLNDGLLTVDDHRLLPALRHLLHLRGLGVFSQRETGESVDLGFVGHLPGLTNLVVQGDATNGRVLVGHNLAALKMEAAAFYGIGAAEWPRLRDLALDKVMETAPLAGIRLPSLTHLSLELTFIAALEALPDAPALAELTLGFGTPLDLSPLRTAAVPTIELVYAGSRPLDLRPLAGRRAVKVTLFDSDAQVLGADDLGPESNVRRIT